MLGQRFQNLFLIFFFFFTQLYCLYILLYLQVESRYTERKFVSFYFGLEDKHSLAKRLSSTSCASIFSWLFCTACEFMVVHGARAMEGRHTQVRNDGRRGMRTGHAPKRRKTSDTWRNMADFGAPKPDVPNSLIKSPTRFGPLHFDSHPQSTVLFLPTGG